MVTVGKLEKAVTRLIVECGLPVFLVEVPAFRHLENCCYLPCPALYMRRTACAVNRVHLLPGFVV